MTAGKAGFLSTIDEIIDDARNGRMFILVDDEDRENEGDLVIPGQMVTPNAINFMASFGRGLICLAMTAERVNTLGLQPMSSRNNAPLQTAFTVSIEARDGVSTGISAADRARTVITAIDAANGPDAIVTPGHIFPLTAREGGVLVRAGHTEAAVDISRLAGLNPSGVICEIMNDDGTMARLDDLIAFSRRHDLRIGTIRDLIAYRRKHDHLVEKEGEQEFSMPGGSTWRAISYRNRVDDVTHMVLLKGEVAPGQPTLIRMHSLSLFEDTLGCPGPRRNLLQRSIAAIEAEGRGIVVLVRPPTTALHPERGRGDDEADIDMRTYGIGAQILADMDVHDLAVLTNGHLNLVALEGWGMSVTEQRPIPD